MSETTAIRTVAPAGLSLRRATDADVAFLAAVYSSTRQEELSVVPWTGEQKAAFLQWQFDCQHRYYHEYYPDCEFLIVEKTSGSAPEPIGRLYVDRWPREIRIVDVALLPAHRGAGLGRALLQSIMDEAAASGRAVTIHVEVNNRALGLYERLGFAHVDTNGAYNLMRWTPDAVAGALR